MNKHVSKIDLRGTITDDKYCPFLNTDTVRCTWAYSHHSMNKDQYICECQSIKPSPQKQYQTKIGEYK